jgi:hypothetical protein
MTDIFVFPTEIPKKIISQKTKRAMSLVGTGSTPPPVNNFYPTPPEATRALMDKEVFDGTIWEPACGDGAMVRVFEEYGHKNIISTDLIDRGFGISPHDFLTSDLRADNVITNPPFKISEEFVRKALASSTKKVAMLQKIQFLEGQKRKILFAETPLKAVYVFSKRINFYREGQQADYSTSMMAFAWYVWEHGYAGEPVIRWI